MDLKALDSILLDQKEEARRLLEAEDLVERDVDRQRLLGFLSRPNILAVLGVRRCGKSTLSHMVLKGHEYGYVNFDDERFRGMSGADLNDVLEALYRLNGDVEYLILDEIQNVDGWELFANRLRRTRRVVITGSNANLLSGELATHLTGRYIDFNLYPFSFGEYLAYKGMRVGNAYSTRELARVRTALEEYLRTGGFPEVLTFGDRMARAIYSDIISKDIVARHGIRNSSTFEELARYMISNAANEFTFSKLRNIFGVGRIETIRGYVDHLVSSYLVFTVERFSPKLKQQFIAPRKMYCIDNGIISAVGFPTSDNVGALMENTVAVELHRRKDLSSGNRAIYYWKDHQQREVDFVVRDGKKAVELIQVTHATDLQDVREREIKALHKAREDLGCDRLTMITWDYEDDARDINYMPLWKWLLGELQ
jgi:predicted AAA+ superfamily ATPase